MNVAIQVAGMSCERCARSLEHLRRGRRWVLRR